MCYVRRFRRIVTLVMTLKSPTAKPAKSNGTSADRLEDVLVLFEDVSVVSLVVLLVEVLVDVSVVGTSW